MIKHITLLGAATAGLTLLAAQPAAAQLTGVLNPGSGTPAVLTSASYGQNFDELKSITSDPTPNTFLPTGWQTFEVGPNANNSYQFGTSSSSVSGSWSYGLGDDRAFGGLTNTSVSHVFVGAIFRNDLGGTIDSLALGYTGEQWHNGFNRQTLRFEYSLDATSINDGTWTSVSALDFVAPNIATHPGSQFATYSLNGNQAANRTALSGTIDGLSIAAGSTFALRWTQIDLPGTASNDGLGIDDFTLAATLAPAGVVPEPATWAMMIGGIGLAGGALRRRQRTAVRFA